MSQKQEQISGVCQAAGMDGRPMHGMGGSQAGGMTDPQPGTEHVARIERLGMGAEGVSRIGGVAVFSPHALPGEVTRLVVSERRAAFARARVVGPPLNESCSRHRAEPPCPLFGRCGGCSLMHMSYGLELDWKRQMVVDAFERVGGFRNMKVDDALGDYADMPSACTSAQASEREGVQSSEGTCAQSRKGAGAQESEKAAMAANALGGARARYRNKARFAVQDGRVGFREARGARVIDVRDCLLQKQATMHAAAAIRENIGMFRDLGAPLSEITVRAPDRPGSVSIVLHAPGGKLPARCLRGGGYARGHMPFVDALVERVPGLSSVIADFGPRSGAAPPPSILFGGMCVSEDACGMTFDVPAMSFFQVNSRMAEKLFAVAVESAGVNGGDSAIDLFCGVGVMAVMLAARCKAAVGVETDAFAVRFARRNAKNNGVGNAEFITARAESAVANALALCVGAPAAIVLDPPRRGMHPSLADAIAKSGASRVVCVSCEPRTMARDAARICGAGSYSVARATPIDMFPRTAHVETVTVLERL